MRITTLTKSSLALLACAALALAACDETKKCQEGQTDCDGTCVDLATDEGHCGKCGEVCSEGAGFICSASSCTCAGNKTDCDGACVGTDTDPKHCGECGKACADGEVCNGGSCVPAGACKAPKKVCEGSCVDVDADNDNCGDCGTSCDTTKGFSCTAGACKCVSPLSECDGACINTATAPDNCGACGTACGAGEVCEGGQCKGGCSAPLTDCAGACVDTSSDSNNCGKCGTACETGNGLICQSGSCACAIGELCDGQCVDTDTNGFHCGTCNNQCDPGQACLGGKCTIDCDPLTQCGNKCVDTTTDPAHCGGCDQACTGGKLCALSVCLCPPSLPDTCDDACTDKQTDELNCGTCGNACSGGESCVAGKCQAAQLLSLAIECPAGTVPAGTVMSCTATGTLQSGQTANLTADLNLTWALENVSSGCGFGLSTPPDAEADVATISNTPPTKGQLAANDKADGCTVDLKATYVAGVQTLISNVVTITIVERKLLSIAISPDNPTVPNLAVPVPDVDDASPSPADDAPPVDLLQMAHLRINFKVVGTYDSGQVKEVQRVKPSGASYDWTIGNQNTVALYPGTEDDPIAQAWLADTNAPTATVNTNVMVTYREDSSDSTTEKTANTILTVVPGNATGMSIQPSTATIPLGPIAFSAVANFNNTLDFDVVDLCHPYFFVELMNDVDFTKHYEGFCLSGAFSIGGGLGGIIGGLGAIEPAFYMQEVPSGSTGPVPPLDTIELVFALLLGGGGAIPEPWPHFDELYGFFGLLVRGTPGEAGAAPAGPVIGLPDQDMLLYYLIVSLFLGHGHQLVLPPDAPDYTPRKAEMWADQQTPAGSPALIEASFANQAYGTTRVFARAQVTVEDAALTECKFYTGLGPVPAGGTGPMPPTSYEISELNANDTYPTGLFNHQIHVVGKLSNETYQDLTATVTYTSSNGATVEASNGVGTEGELDFKAAGGALVTATDPASGVSCTAQLKVVKGTLCGIQALPLYKGQIGRRAYHRWGGSSFLDGPADGGHDGFNEVALPNEAGWSQAYRLYAWYSADPDGCPEGKPLPSCTEKWCGCPVTYDDETGDFKAEQAVLSGANVRSATLLPPPTKTICFKSDVTDKATWAVIPDATPPVADPALASAGEGLFNVQPSATNHSRIDQVKATYVDAVTASTTETVTVCGTRTNPVVFQLWSAFENSVAASDSTKATVPIGATVDYQASLELQGIDFDTGAVKNCGNLGTDRYRLQITESVNAWTSGDTSVATVATDANKRGEVSGLKIGTTTISATYDGITSVLNTSVADLAVASCEVTVPLTVLEHGAGFGESMQPTVSATLTNGDVIDITAGFPSTIPGCPDNADGDKVCPLSWSSQPTAGSPNIAVDGDSGLTLAGPAGSDTTADRAQITATCVKCTVDQQNIDCTPSKDVEIVAAAVTGLSIQREGVSCAAGGAGDLKLNDGTQADLKGCLRWSHGAVGELDSQSNSPDLGWSGGTSLTVDSAGGINVAGSGANTVTATYSPTGATATIDIEATTDKLDSFEIRGRNIGAPGCDALTTPAPPADGLQGCELEGTNVRYWLAGVRADGSVQDLTVMGTGWTDSKTLLAFGGTVPGGHAAIGPVAAGQVVDTLVSVNTAAIPDAACSGAGGCPDTVSANVRIFDADPTVASHEITASPALLSGAGQRVSLRATAQPNIATPVTIDITHDSVFTAESRGHFYCYDLASDTATGLNGTCVSMPVSALTNTTITGTFDKSAATTLEKSTPVAITP